MTGRQALNTEERKAIEREEKAAILRVLRLVDGYLSTRPQDTLLAWNGGMMTWGELRKHVKGAIKLARKRK